MLWGQGTGSPQGSSVEVPAPRTSECDGSRVVAAVSSREEVTLDGAGWDPTASMAGPRKTGNFGHTDRHTAERQREDPSGSHGLPEATGGWDRGPERTLPWSRRREQGPARILVWDLRPPTLRP